MLANSVVEQMNREGMQRLQLSRLQKQVKWALEKSGFNRDRLTAAGVDGHTVEALEDIVRLPVTRAEELCSVSPYDVMTLPINGMLRVASFGMERLVLANEKDNPAEGKADALGESRLIKAFTGGDIAQNMEMVTRALKCYGINQTSMIGVFGPAGHTGLLDLQYALEGLGATVMLLGNDAAAARCMLDKLYIDMLVTDTAGLAAMGEMAHSLKRILCLCSFSELEAYAASTDDSMRTPGQVDDMEEQQLIYFPYSPELGAAGVMFDCLEGDSAKGKGYHINEDLFYPEISDSGELLLTTLNAEAMPVLRFNTGLHGKLCYGRCRCGRMLARFNLVR